MSSRLKILLQSRPLTAPGSSAVSSLSCRGPTRRDLVLVGLSELFVTWHHHPASVAI